MGRTKLPCGLGFRTTDPSDRCTKVARRKSVGAGWSLCRAFWLKQQGTQTPRQAWLAGVKQRQRKARKLKELPVDSTADKNSGELVECEGLSEFEAAIISQQQRTKGLYCLSKGQQTCSLYLLTVLFPKIRCISRLNGRNVGLARTLKRNLRDTAIAKTTRNRSCTRLSRECSRRFMNLGSRKAKGG